MNIRIAVLVMLMGTLLAASGCVNQQAQEAKSETNLTKEKVIRIAEQIAISEEYDLQKYNMTGCHYEFTHKDQTWTVFYELKPPIPPGGHFMVSVDDQTKNATLAHGE